MTRQHDRISERDGIDRDRPADRRLDERSVLSTAGPCAIAGLRAIRGPLSMLGMALGYLGLVAILSMAPFWHLAVTPHQNQTMACTDFGGSR